MIEKKELLSDKITKGRRTYFFDIKESEKGDIYLSISESKRIAKDIQRSRIIIFEDDIQDFRKTLIDMLWRFENLLRDDTNLRKDHIERSREKHGRAYRPWSNQDDEKLEQFYCEGKTTKELSDIFERSMSAIKSRIKRLELFEKYG